MTQDKNISESYRKSIMERIETDCLFLGLETSWDLSIGTTRVYETIRNIPVRWARQIARKGYNVPKVKLDRMRIAEAIVSAIAEQRKEG